jgi:hypothetical protein
MTVIDHAFSRLSVTKPVGDSFKAAAKFCGIGLFVFVVFWLLSLTYGLDLSPGFF